MAAINDSLQLSAKSSEDLTLQDKLGLGMVGLSLLSMLGAAFGGGQNMPYFYMLSSLGFLIVGSLIYFANFLRKPKGTINNNLLFTNVLSRGAWGWILAVGLTGFYVIIYWHSQFQALNGLIAMLDPFSKALTGGPATQWFLYGTFYTLAILLMGFRAIFKYRHNKYQIVRTISVMFFQLGFAFLLPYFLKKLNEPSFYFTYFWPLEQSYLFPSKVSTLSQEGALGTFMVFWGAMMTFIATPTLTYFFGKRWYCSWVCGCGGLAETAGDPFRHLSDKSMSAWQVERWLIHGVLVLITLGTIILWIDQSTSGAFLGPVSTYFSQWYGFYIGAVFSGVIGVGFYPIMGSRVWCRFGCPMAAILGIFQRYFSRFRITTNGNQCISCGNCSKYCEMGIDVQAYAQRGDNIVRAACVGCGLCEEVCPRGVLHLENGPPKHQRPHAQVTSNGIKIYNKSH